MDLVADPLLDGCRFRALMIVDQFTWECPAIAPDFSFTGKRVVSVLERLRRRLALPESITVDNGSEFVSRSMDACAYRNEVKLKFIRPGKPVENCFNESFNGRLRDESLNVNVPLGDG